MHYEIELPQLPAGFALSSGEEGENIDILKSTFITDQNGSIFYRILESFGSMFLQPFLTSGGQVSIIDHCLVIVDRSLKATVYINELDMILTTIPKRDVDAGEVVLKFDIAGLLDLSFRNLPIPNDNGIYFYFSVGWRRGFFFDISPLDSSVASVEIGKKLAQSYEHLLFYEIYSLNTELWLQFFSFGWFPFVSVLDAAFEHLLDRIREGKSIESAEATIIQSFDRNKLLKLLEKYRKNGLFSQHIQIIEIGIERFLAGDYISSINNIWPRIEGVLTYAFAGGEKIKQDKLVQRMRNTIADSTSSPSLFLPDLFKEYLLKYYFKNFDIPKGELDVSRHSIGHGVSKPESYDRKTALIGILILDQLSYYLNVK